MTIHKEGYRIIFLVLFFVILLNTVLYMYYPRNNVYMVISILSILIAAFTISFFRHPKRLIPMGENNVLAPADGKVVVIEETMENEYFHDARLQISVFMSPANVHVNRAPVDGEIVYFKYHPGRYLVAWNPKSSTDNERTSFVIKNEFCSVLVRQIAGKLARRIVYYIEEGDEIEGGEEFGFIKFGSRIDLFLPLNTQLNVKIGDKVRGGETIIGHLA